MRRFSKYSLTVTGVLMGLLLLSGTVLAASSGGDWSFAGANLQNTRYQNNPVQISLGNASKLGVQWQFVTGGDVSATPALDANNAYFPDAAGNLYAVNRATGQQVWSHQIVEYTGVTGDYARTTPAIVGNALIFGDQAGKVGQPASIIAVDISTGNLLWRTQADSSPYSIITQSAVANGQDVYVGVSSVEELFAGVTAGYTCCSFRGSVLNLDAATGQIRWRTYTVPEYYSGGAVWGSTDAIDTARGSLYVTTGNNYSVPADRADCVVANDGNPVAQQACLPNDYFDSILALDLHTGAVKWAFRALSSDAWNVGCGLDAIFPGFPVANPGACPNDPGPDYDFGQGPALFTTHAPGSGKPVDLVGAGQKSGKYWALNADTGAVVWSTQVGPGGVSGGLQWGSSTDGSTIWAASANSEKKDWTLVQNGQTTGTTITGGHWSAIDAATGKILWQTADPNGAGDPGAVSGANGVVYACSSSGNMYALHGKKGTILWSYPSGHTCYAGSAISNGTVYWGTGYSLFEPQAPSTLTAFSLK
jgi:polyvinyl alcohol dehydrogenase (cytochrome)